MCSFGFLFHFIVFLCGSAEAPDPRLTINPCNSCVLNKINWLVWMNKINILLIIFQQPFGFNYYREEWQTKNAFGLKHLSVY